MKALLIMALLVYLFYSYAKNPVGFRGGLVSLGIEGVDPNQSALDKIAAIPGLKSRAFLRGGNAEVCQYASGFQFGACNDRSSFGDVVGSAFTPNSPYDGSIGNGINFGPGR